MPKELAQSTPATIKRSQISLNPYNPKHHTEEAVKQQLKNFKRNGYLGGILWNSTSGNLIDGHRRVQALDLYYHYDGTPATDYEVRVESVAFDDKTEKEQMTYMAIGNSKADYNLIAPYAADLDPEAIGISPQELQQIADLAGIPDQQENAAPVHFETMDDAFLAFKKDTPSAELQEKHAQGKGTRESVRAEKEKCNDVALRNQGTASQYAIVVFDDDEQKQLFCEILQVANEPNVVVRASALLSGLDL